jgi:hypothetical protein
MAINNLLGDEDPTKFGSQQRSARGLPRTDGS